MPRVGIATGWTSLCLAAWVATATAQSPRPAQPKANVSKKDEPKKAVARDMDPTGADVVTLRDGAKLLGQVYDGSPRGVLIVFVRRTWAEANLPAWAERWKRAEAAEQRPAEAARRERLLAWRRERVVDPAGPDRITSWIDRELTKPVGSETPSPLMAVRIPRADVKLIDRRGTAASRSLRLGWTLGFTDVETMPLAELNDAIAGRGLTARGTATIPIDALLPMPVESDAQWLRRRAATEVVNDEGLRFVRFGNTILPEPKAGQPNVAAVGDSVLSDTIKEILGVPSPDPLPAKLREVTARGRVGAMVTRLDLAPDMESVVVEAALYVRGPRGDWSKTDWRSGTIRSGDVAPGAVDAIADDPQVKSLFGLVDSFGFGGVSTEMKRKSLTVGAMTRKALGLARSALARELSLIALPMDAQAPEPARDRP